MPEFAPSINPKPSSDTIPIGASTAATARLVKLPAAARYTGRSRVKRSTRTLTLRTQLLWCRLPAFPPADLLQVSFIMRDFNTSAAIIRAGVNYKFDWFAPPPAVVAKY